MTLQLCCFYLAGHGARLGAYDAGRVIDLTSSGMAHFSSLTALLQASSTTSIDQLLQDVSLSDLPSFSYSDLDRPPDPEHSYLLPPVDRQEVWAAGVTYAWSREARVREARAKEIYVRVYDAERPELFFKSTAEKVVGPNDWIGIRGDSAWNVPEPELALVLNPAMQVIGYTIGNDVSSRDIEGENPLYLPQAKVFRHGCSLGPTIIVAGEDFHADDLIVSLSILRDGAEAFSAETRTSEIRRSFAELAGFLGRYNDFPYGAVLLTGTGIVPGDEFTLQDGDEVSIEIDGLGVLGNHVKQM